MRASYGEFLHPDADDKLGDYLRNGDSIEMALMRAQLGAKPYDYNRDIVFLANVSDRIANYLGRDAMMPQ